MSDNTKVLISLPFLGVIFYLGFIGLFSLTNKPWDCQTGGLFPGNYTGVRHDGDRKLYCFHGKLVHVTYGKPWYDQ